MKSSLGDAEKGLADKLADDEKETIEQALDEANEWLDEHQDAEKEDFDEKLREVQAVCAPVVTRAYGAGVDKGGGSADDLDEGMEDL